jgi:hypothetical protein
MLFPQATETQVFQSKEETTAETDSKIAPISKTSNLSSLATAEPTKTNFRPTAPLTTAPLTTVKPFAVTLNVDHLWDYLRDNLSGTKKSAEAPFLINSFTLMLIS